MTDCKLSPAVVRGALTLVDQDGRELKGIENLTVSAPREGVVTATVTLALHGKDGRKMAGRVPPEGTLSDVEARIKELRQRGMLPDCHCNFDARSSEATNTYKLYVSF